MIPNIKKAKEILEKYVKEKANLEHSLLVGYGLLGVAKHLGKPEEELNYWFAVGALHDIDIECFGGDISKHTLVGEDILKKEGINQKIIDDIKSHNESVCQERTTEIQHALYSLDGLTGIIRAYVLMRPDKDISKAETKSILKKLKDKFFAVAVNREKIALCEKTLNMSLEKFIEVVLEEIKKNADSFKF